MCEDGPIATLAPNIVNAGTPYADLQSPWMPWRGCGRGGVGDSALPRAVGSATKPAHATAMITRAMQASVPTAWVAGDEVHGADPLCVQRLVGSRWRGTR